MASMKTRSAYDGLCLSSSFLVNKHLILLCTTVYHLISTWYNIGAVECDRTSRNGTECKYFDLCGRDLQVQ